MPRKKSRAAKPRGEAHRTPHTKVRSKVHYQVPPVIAGRFHEFEDFAENLEEMIVLIDRDYRIVMANRAYLRHRGANREQIVGHLMSDLLSEGVFENVLKPRLDECLQGRVVKFEMKYQYSHLGERDLIVSYFPINGPSRVDLVACAFEDITNRKRADAKIRRERDRAQRYLDVADVILLALDLKGHVTLINRKGCSTLGREERELLGRDWVGLCVPAGIRQKVRTIFDELVGGDLSYVENPILTKSGEERMIAWRNTLLRDDEGRVTGTLSSGEDITDRQRAQASLSLFRTLIDQSGDGIEVLDPDTLRILDVNEKACASHGYTRMEMLSSSVFDLDPTLDIEKQKKDAAELRKFRILIKESVRQKKDGSTFPVELNLRLVTLDDQDYVIAVARDITDRKRAEFQLRKLSGHLLQVQDDERRRLARELHDGIGTYVTGLSLALGKIRNFLDETNPAHQMVIEECKELIQTTCGEIRSISYLLHPPALEELGLESTLDWLVRGFSNRSDIQISLKMDSHLGRFKPEIELTLFRVVQEALNNVYRHSGSSTATVRLFRKCESIVVEIADRGRGMLPSSPGQRPY